MRGKKRVKGGSCVVTMIAFISSGMGIGYSTWLDTLTVESKITTDYIAIAPYSNVETYPFVLQRFQDNTITREQLMTDVTIYNHSSVFITYLGYNKEAILIDETGAEKRIGLKNQGVNAISDVIVKREGSEGVEIRMLFGSELNEMLVNDAFLYEGRHVILKLYVYVGPPTTQMPSEAKTEGMTTTEEDNVRGWYEGVWIQIPIEHTPFLIEEEWRGE